MLSKNKSPNRTELKVLCSVNLCNEVITEPHKSFSLSTVNGFDEKVDLIALRLAQTGKCFPIGFDPIFWFGVYFSLQHSFIALMMSDFNWLSEHLPLQESGFLLLIKKDFLPAEKVSKIAKLPIFLEKGFGPFMLNTSQQTELSWIFNQIWEQTDTCYKYRKELINDLVILIIHFVTKHFSTCSTIASKDNEG